MKFSQPFLNSRAKTGHRKSFLSTWTSLYMWTNMVFFGNPPQLPLSCPHGLWMKIWFSLLKTYKFTGQNLVFNNSVWKILRIYVQMSLRRFNLKTRNTPVDRILNGKLLRWVLSNWIIYNIIQLLSSDVTCAIVLL